MFLQPYLSISIQQLGLIIQWLSRSLVKYDVACFQCDVTCLKYNADPSNKIHTTLLKIAGKIGDNENR